MDGMMDPLQQLGKGLLAMVREAQALAPRLREPERIVREFQMEAASGPTQQMTDYTSIIPGYPRVKLTLEIVPAARAEKEDAEASAYYHEQEQSP